MKREGGDSDRHRPWRKVKRWPAYLTWEESHAPLDSWTHLERQQKYRGRWQRDARGEVIDTWRLGGSWIDDRGGHYEGTETMEREEHDAERYSDAMREDSTIDQPRNPWLEYQDFVRDLFVYRDQPHTATLPYLALGLAGEAGEVAERIKKWLGHGAYLDYGEMIRELGDVLWYLTALAREMGVGVEDVRDINIAKLRARYPDGFRKGGGIR